jgi:hypothetical protein
MILWDDPVRESGYVEDLEPEGGTRECSVPSLSSSSSSRRYHDSRKCSGCAVSVLGQFTCLS